MNQALLRRYNDRGLQLLTEDDINFIIKENKLDASKISDGDHSFEELYNHRIQLFITLCRTLQNRDECDFAETSLVAPEWDGHTSEQVIERLKNL